MEIPNKYLHLALELEKFYKIDIQSEPGFSLKESLASDSLIVTIYRKLLIRSENEPKFQGWRFTLDTQTLLIKEMGSDLKAETEIKITDLGPISQQREEELYIFWTAFAQTQSSAFEAVGFNSLNHCVEIIDQKDTVRIRIWNDILGELIYDSWVDLTSMKVSTNTFKILH